MGTRIWQMIRNADQMDFLQKKRLKISRFCKSKFVYQKLQFSHICR